MRPGSSDDHHVAAVVVASVAERRAIEIVGDEIAKRRLRYPPRSARVIAEPTFIETHRRRKRTRKAGIETRRRRRGSAVRWRSVVVGDRVRRGVEIRRSIWASNMNDVCASREPAGSSSPDEIMSSSGSIFPHAAIATATNATHPAPTKNRRMCFEPMANARAIHQLSRTEYAARCVRTTDRDARRSCAFYR